MIFFAFWPVFSQCSNESYHSFLFQVSSTPLLLFESVLCKKFVNSINSKKHDVLTYNIDAFVNLKEKLSKTLEVSCYHNSDIWDGDWRGCVINWFLQQQPLWPTRIAASIVALKAPFNNERKNTKNCTIFPSVSYGMGSFQDMNRRWIMTPPLGRRLHYWTFATTQTINIIIIITTIDITSTMTIDHQHHH